MDLNTKVRGIGGIICTIALFYYLYEIYGQISNWSSFEEIKSITECSQIFVLEVWVLSLSMVWSLCISIMLVVIISPSSYKILLCFLYVFGPVHFLWTCLAIISFAYFEICCYEREDECMNFYPHSHPVHIASLLAISLVLSLMVSIGLLFMMFGTFWSTISGLLNGYMELLS